MTAPAHDPDPQEIIELPGYEPPDDDPTDDEPQPGDLNYVEPAVLPGDLR